MINEMVTRRRAIVLAAILLFVTVLWLLPRFPQAQSILSQPPAISGISLPPERRLPEAYMADLETPRSQADFEYEERAMSWTNLNPDFEHKVLTDDAAAELVASLYNRFPEIQEAFTSLPEPVLKADFFRYLVLLAQGGVYSDIDTTALKPVDTWVSDDMQPYGLVVGIEADANRPDWSQWYSRRLQFCQWTIMSKVGHPVLVETVALITEEALRLNATGELTKESMKSVVDFTGPGLWTDSLFDFFNRSSPSPSDTTDGIDAMPWTERSI